MLTAPVIMALLFLCPQLGVSSTDNEAFAKWRPGPNIAQELARLEHSGKQIFSEFRNGKIAQLRAIRELARVRATMDTLRSWSFEHHSDQVPQIVVLIDNDEFEQVFPRGMKHLPRQLTPGERYVAAPGSSKQWEYLGERRMSGMRLSIFRYFTEPANSSGTRIE